MVRGIASGRVFRVAGMCGRAAAVAVGVWLLGGLAGCSQMQLTHALEVQGPVS